MSDLHVVQPVADAETAGLAGQDGHVKSLAKGLRALDLLIERADVGTNEVAQALRIDKGAASRTMQTLVAAGYAVQNAKRRWQCGPKLRGRSAPVGPPIRERARPLLERLHAATGETAHLAIRADDRVLYLDKVETDLPLRVDRPVGTLSPLHCTALGKIFLAFGEAPFPRTLAGYTNRTAMDLDALRAALARIVEDGFAIDDEEFAVGIRCVAAPLRDAGGRVIAAIGISGPTARITPAHLSNYGRLAMEVASEFPA